MQMRPALPGAITTARVVLWIQFTFLLLGALVILAAGNLVGAISSSVGGGVAIFSIIPIAMAVALAWSAIALGKLAPGARLTALIFEWIFLGLGLLALFGAVTSSGSCSGTGDTFACTTGPSAGSIIGVLIGLGMDIAVIMSLQFNAQVRAAFAATRTGQYPMGYGAPPPLPYPGQAQFPGQAYPPPPGYPAPPVGQAIYTPPQEGTYSPAPPTAPPTAPPAAPPAAPPYSPPPVDPGPPGA